MKIDDLFFEIQGIEELFNFVTLKQNEASNFPEGFVLHEDLKNVHGAMLLVAGHKLSPVELQKLIHMKNETNQNFSFKFIYSKQITDFIEQIILKDFNTIIDEWTKKGLLRSSSTQWINEATSPIKKTFKQNQILFKLYSYRLNESSVNPEIKDNRFYILILNIMILAVVLAKMVEKDSHFSDMSQQDREILCKVTILQFSSVNEHIAELKKQTQQSVKEYFESVILKSDNELVDQRVDCDSVNTQSYISLYININKKLQDANLSGYKYGRFITIALRFFSLTSPIFHSYISPQELLDVMYKESFQGMISPILVNKIAISLDMSFLFDYYTELQRLISLCPHKCGMPYPFKGFKSATFFVCADKRQTCQYFSHGVESVKIFLDNDILPKGGYHQCTFLSDKLQAFYKLFYRKIKEDAKRDIKEIL